MTFFVVVLLKLSFPCGKWDFVIYSPILKTSFREGISLLCVYIWHFYFHESCFPYPWLTLFPCLESFLSPFLLPLLSVSYWAMPSFLTWGHIAASMSVRPLFHSTPSSVGWCFEPTAAPSFWKRWAQNETFSPGRREKEQGHCKKRQEGPKAVHTLTSTASYLVRDRRYREVSWQSRQAFTLHSQQVCSQVLLHTQTEGYSW